MRVFFVVNPTAGHGRARQAWANLEPYLRELGEYQVAFTDCPGHAGQLAREAAQAGYDRVVAMGGDGTVGEVAGGLVGTGAALGIIPSGTGNDYVRTLGIPRRPREAAQLAFTAPDRPVDMGLHLESGRYFINIAGIGFDAEVSREVNTRRLLKTIPGTFPSVVGVILTLLRYHNPEMTIELDGQALQRRVILLAVGMAQYYGGGMKVLPDAVLDDGFFSVVVGGDIGKLEVVGFLPKLYSGRHVGHPKVEFHRAREVRVTSETPVAVHLDGDVVGTLPATFRLVPGAIRVVAP